MPCPVCQHNQVHNIDRALLAGADLTSLSRKFGFSPESLHRHQRHLQQKMAQTSRRFHDNLHQSLFCKLSQIMEMVSHVVREAMKGEDYKFFLQASREFTRITNLMHKMAAKLQLDPEFIYCLLASPQWDLQEESLLPQSFQAMTENRQSLKLNLFAPCPELETELEPDAMPTIPFANPGSESATQAPAGGLPKKVLSKPQTSGPLARRHREISAKLARKIGSPNKVNEGYQLDNLCEKKSPEKRENLFRKLFWKWEKSGKLLGKKPSPKP